MPRLQPSLLPTGIGSLPHTDISSAIELMLKTTPEIPFCPQFPKMGFSENMYAQFAYDLPGAVIDEGKGKIYIDTSSDCAASTEELYKNHLENRVESFAIDKSHLSGLYAIRESRQRFKPAAVKGELTGPVSLGLSIADEAGKPILYNDNYMEIVTKSLAMKAKWLEKSLKEISPVTIISVDEPYLGQLGSAYINIDRGKASAMLSEVFSAMGGIKGVHCCSNTDWEFLLKLGIDVVFFDAYKDAKTLLIYPSEIKEYIEGGGMISWGIVPNDGNSIKGETVQSLAEKMERNFQSLTVKGVDMQKLLRQSLLSTSCGLGSCENAVEAEGMMEVLRTLSMTLRRRFGIESEREEKGADNTMRRLL
jgi:hypothetical protein